MRPPRIPPMISDIVQTAIYAFDNMQFSTLSECPFCGGKVQGYDTRQKKFAFVRDGSAKRAITIRVKRFTCRDCHRLVNADEPFYPDTRIGSIIIDLYFTFATIMPKSKAARLLDAMGIVVDRTTWKNYSDRTMPEIPVADVFGIPLPLSVISLSVLASKTQDMGNIHCDEILSACGFPSANQKAGSIHPEKEKFSSPGHGINTPNSRDPVINVRSGFPVTADTSQGLPDGMG